MTYVSRRPARAHQAEALERVANKRAFAILAGLRTGKTKVVVDDFGRMISEGRVQDLLVVAPAGAYLPWRNAVMEDLPEEIAATLKIFVWVSRTIRTARAKSELREFGHHSGPRVLIMNIEAISMMKAARDTVVWYLQRNPNKNMWVVDESVVIKQPTSRCGKFCVEAAPLAAYRRILSGLVSPRSPLDLWNQFRFLDPTILNYTNFISFRSRYAEIKQLCMLPGRVVRAQLKSLAGVGKAATRAQLIGRAAALDPTQALNFNSISDEQLRNYIEVAVDGMTFNQAVEAVPRLGGYIQTIPIIEGYKNVDELRERIAPHSFRVRLEDCYDMPPVDYSFRDVDWTDEQRRLYDEVKANACAQLESLDYVTATHVVIQMLRLHQVLCGHVRDETGKLHDVPENRTTSLVDFLDDYEGKAVVWCSYDPDVRRVSEALKKRFGDEAVSRFWGGNVRTREEEEVRFKTDAACRFQVATPDAGGRGRDWSVADLVCYYSSRNNLDHRQQSEDRVKAVDKTRPIAYVDFRIPGTVEDKILQCLREKIDMAATINGDAWREWLV